MRLLLVGYGRMGKLVERLAPDYGFDVVGHLDDTNNSEPWALRRRRPLT